MQGKHGHLSRQQKQLALRLHAKGWRLVDIAREIGCSAPMVGIMARSGRHLDPKPFGWEPRVGHLTIEEREQILLGLNRGDTLTAIAQGLGRAVSTISREVVRGGGRVGYSAWHAHEPARHQARRPKPCKLVEGRLLAEVAGRLERLWSPQEIVARLRLEHPDDPEMRASHETIYQSLFVQGRGELRRELARCLRRSWSQRSCSCRYCGPAVARAGAARAVLRAFGWPVATCVAVMLVTGVYLASSVVGSVDAALVTV